MPSRRTFIQATAAVVLSGAARAAELPRGTPEKNFPMVVSTWGHGIAANAVAWKTLSENGRAFDAVEQGIREPEGDPKVTSVGYGGFPDREGIVSLDACIVDERGNCGSVAAMENIMHPISVARMIMEKTPHVMLVGEGAQQFALENGFPKENLLTDDAKRAWEQWKREGSVAKQHIDPKHHDILGMLAIDASGKLSGGCSTSGLAFKLHGRVGDSPLIGAGLFCDGDVGGACATGVGEAVIKICGSHFIVERMRAGISPQEACRDAVDLIAKRFPQYQQNQVAFLAVNMHGDVGACAMHPGFQFAQCIGGENVLRDAESVK